MEILSASHNQVGVQSPKALPDLLGAEGADAVESEAEYHAVFLSDTHIKSVVLRRYRAAVPTVADRHRGADEGAAIGPRARLKIEEERRAAKQSAFAIA